jgi:hypothetical protein
MCFVVSASAIAQDGRSTQSTFGSSLFISGGYGLPSNARVEGGYVFGEIVSIALLFTGPYSAETMTSFNVGATGRIFVPIPTGRFAPFLSASYTDSSPFTLLAGDSRREETSISAGTLFTLSPGAHLRGELGSAQVNDEEWQLSWNLQFELTLGALSTR